MSHALTLYFNPSCSKSQKAVELLNQLNYPHNTVDYIQNGLTAQELNNLIGILKIPAQDIVRKDDLKKYDLSPDILLSHESIIATLSTIPALLQRPILLFKAEQGIIARPPENIMAFLEPLKLYF